MKSKYRTLLLVLILLFMTALPGRGASAAAEVSATQWHSSLQLAGLNAAAGTGWQYKNGSWYYYDSDGRMHIGWLYDHGAWYYLGSSGAMKRGWLYDRGAWYYLGGSGAMKTGWLYDQGLWYYLSSSGAMKTGWLKDRGVWYYLKGNGAMATGWLDYQGARYYLDGSGAMKTGWQYIDRKWYHMNSAGAVEKGWKYIGGKWYYLSMQDKGAMLTGWQELGGKRYFLNPSGDMADGFRILDGKAYYFGSDGALKEDWASKNVIVIDPGHSSEIPDGQVPLGPGSDEMKDADNYGAVSVTNGLHEYELVLDVSLMLRDKLEARGYKVVMVRTTNTGKYSCLYRAKVANDNNAAIFLRVHANAAPKDHSKNGAMTICITEDNEFVPAMYKKSRLLSDLILSNYVAAVGCFNEGVWERDDMVANNWSKVPTTLVELGYMTNEREDQLMQTDAYKEKMANGLLYGVDAYFKATLK